MNVYIHALNKFPTTDWGVFALLGFKERGVNVRFYEDIQEVPLNRMSMVVGGIEDTHAFFEGMGWEIPKPVTMPESLIKYAGRKIQLMTLGEALKIDTFPFFIKPYSKAKEFYAGVVENAGMLKLFNDDIPRDTMALISEVVNFISEFRCYVSRKEILDIKHYKGDYDQHPNVGLIKQAIEDWEDQPIAYSTDWGITDDGRCLLVENNEGYSLGNYGIQPKHYTRLLIDRWREMLDKNPVKL